MLLSPWRGGEKDAEVMGGGVKRESKKNKSDRITRKQR
jgi:hypothetical protein